MNVNGMNGFERDLADSNKNEKIIYNLCNTRKTYESSSI